MSTSTSREEAGGPGRQRKAHRKSRHGCSNCKLRSVKCDEAKPSCRRCAASGFACSYARSAAGGHDLQLAHAGAFKLDLAPGLPGPKPRARIPAAVPVSGRIGDYELQPADFAALDRFHKRTSQHLGTAATRPLFSRESFGLGASHPFLLHVFLALALIHDDALAPALSAPSHRSRLAFHWYHGTVLLKQKLARPPHTFTSSERDALWAAAALLGSAALAHLDTEDPANAWPLAPPSPSDLDWLRMGDGKKAVWDVVDPLRPDSLFRSLAQEFERDPAPDGSAPIPPGLLPPLFYSVFGLSPHGPSSEPRSSPSSSPSSLPPPDSPSSSSDVANEENPYYVPACLLAHVLPVRIASHNILRFLTFTSQITPAYKRLLARRDPRALLLLAWWFAKVSPSNAWWLCRRARVEGPAICRFLERECADDPSILALLQFPREELAKEGGKGGGEDQDGVVDGGERTWFVEAPTIGAM